MFDRSFWLLAAHRRILQTARSAVRGNRFERRNAPRRQQVEVLESRLLLSGATGIDESTPLFTKLGSSLALVVQQYDALIATNPQATFTSHDPFVHQIGSSVVVDTVASGKVADLQRDLKALGATVTGSYGKTVSALVPINELQALSNLTSMSMARSSAGKTLGGTGVVTSQGVQAAKI